MDSFNKKQRYLAPTISIHSILYEDPIGANAWGNSNAKASMDLGGDVEDAGFGNN